MLAGDNCAGWSFAGARGSSLGSRRTHCFLSPSHTTTLREVSSSFAVATDAALMQLRQSNTCSRQSATADVGRLSALPIDPFLPIQPAETRVAAPAKAPPLQWYTR